MIAALLFINHKGEVIIYRTYRDNFNRSVADTFRTQVLIDGRRLRAPSPDGRLCRAGRVDASCSASCASPPAPLPR